MISITVIIALIGATTTEKGLAVACILDEATYEKGQKVTDEEFSEINIILADFHGEWNYTIAPNNV